jgi:serine/threonine protein kinase
MQSDPLVGRHLGAYRMLSLVGEGGMARVYKAQHERLQRVVAIKVILPQSAGLADFQARFEQEAKLIARLQHGNIVSVYDFGESANMVYLVMQYVEGGTIRDQLRARQPLPPRRAALYVLQMARALNHAHQHGIVHRDVKPLNMLVPAKQPNELLLSDFGLAKLFAESSEPPYTASIIGVRGVDQLLSLSLSHTGDIIGTPLYISPEQCLSKPVDARTDIYSLGVVLFEMLTGQLPFQGTNIHAILYQHAYEPAPSVREINPAVPESLVQITAHALQKAPEQRYQSAKAMARALEAVLAPPVHGYTPSVPLPAPGDAPPVPAPGPIPGKTPVPRERDKHRKRLVRIVNLVALMLIALLLVQALLRVGILPWFSTIPHGSTQAAPAQGSSCTTTPPSVQAQPFVETFRDDRRGWQPDALQGL